MGTAHQRKTLIFKTIDELYKQYPISRLCKYFEVSRSGYYAWKKLGKPYYKNYDKDLSSRSEPHKEKPITILKSTCISNGPLHTTFPFVLCSISSSNYHYNAKREGALVFITI